jgi:PspA-Associated protein
VIIRILGEGQYDVADHALDRLNELDAALEAAVDAGDEETFAARLTELLDGVRTAGVAHAADSLDESDLILPPADATIEQVREMLDESEEGLIPG